MNRPEKDFCVRMLIQMSIFCQCQFQFCPFLMKQVPGVINTPGDPTRLFDSCQVTNNAKRIGATCYKYNERLNTHFFVCVKTPQFNGGLSLPIPWIKGYFISSSKNQIVCSPYLSIISLLPLERSISSNWFYQGLQAILSTLALP